MIGDIAKSEHLAYFDYEAPLDGRITHPRESQNWLELTRSFSPQIESGAKFIPVRLFVDEFAPFSAPKRKINAIYCTLLNLTRERFNNCRRVLGIIPEDSTYSLTLVFLNFR